MSDYLLAVASQFDDTPPCACGHPESLHRREADGRRTECWATVGASYCGCAAYRQESR